MDTENRVAVRIHEAVDYWAKHMVEQFRNTTMGTRIVSGGRGWGEDKGGTGADPGLTVGEEG